MPRSMTRYASVVLLCAGLSSVGCFESSITLRPACGATAEESNISIALAGSTPANKVDLLLVIDDSGSMAQEQQSVADQFPRLARILATGDRDLDGVADFAPVSDLHIGVVTTDMGVGGFEGIPTCGAGTTAGGAMFGDDGILVTRGNTGVDGCMASYPAFLQFRPGDHPTDLPDALAQFGADGSCVVQPGTSGCGFEQPLEAALKALTPSSNTGTLFFGPSLGHGDVENDGFLRADSVLAIVVVTDEEDCSVDPAHSDVFDQTSSVYTGDLNLRCFNFPEVASPTQRYVDGFRALRPGDSGRLVFALIAGIPQALVADPNTIDYDAILAAPEMQEIIRADGPGAGHQLSPSCTAPAGRGEAFPPRRLVAVARDLGATSTIASICQTDFGPVLDNIITAISNATLQACLDEPLTRSTEGLVACSLEATLPASGVGPLHCAEIAGAISSQTVVVDGRQQCTLSQLAVTEVGGAPSVAAGDGWFYDDFTNRISTACSSMLTAQGVSLQGTTLPEGTTARLRCYTRFEGATVDPPSRGLGAICTAASSPACADPTLPHLFCESSTGTCQMSCSSSDTCPSGLECDTSPSHREAFCVPPICIAR